MDSLITTNELYDVILPEKSYLFRIRTNTNDNATFRFFIYLQTGTVSNWCYENVNDLWPFKAQINNSSIQLYQILEDIELYKLSTNSYELNDVTQDDKNSINRLLNFINTNLNDPNYYNQIKTKMLEGNKLITDTKIRSDYDKLVNNAPELIAVLNYCLLDIYNAAELPEYEQLKTNYENHQVQNIVRNPDLLLAAFFEAANINGWVRVGSVGEPGMFDEIMLTSDIFNNNSKIIKLAEVVKQNDTSFLDICKNILKTFIQPMATYSDAQENLLPLNLKGGNYIYYKKYIKYKKKYLDLKFHKNHFSIE
jgi:hypothetical protein